MKFLAVRYGQAWIDFDMANGYMKEYAVPTLFSENWTKKDLKKLISESEVIGEKVDKDKCRVVEVTLIMKEI